MKEAQVSEWLYDTVASLPNDRPSGIDGLGDAVAIAWANLIKAQSRYRLNTGRSAVISRLLREPLTETGYVTVAECITATPTQHWRYTGTELTELAIKTFNANPKAASILASATPIENLCDIVTRAKAVAVVAAWDAVDKRARRSKNLRAAREAALSGARGSTVFTTPNPQLEPVLHIPVATATSRRYARAVFDTWGEKLWPYLLAEDTLIAWPMLVEAASRVSNTQDANKLAQALCTSTEGASEAKARMTLRGLIEPDEQVAEVVHTLRRVGDAGGEYAASMDTLAYTATTTTPGSGPEWVRQVHQHLAFDPETAVNIYQNGVAGEPGRAWRLTRTATVLAALWQAGAQLYDIEGNWQFELDGFETPWVHLFDEVADPAGAAVAISQAGYDCAWSKLARNTAERTMLQLAMRDEVVRTGTVNAWVGLWRTGPGLPQQWWSELCEVEELSVLEEVTSRAGTAGKRTALAAAINLLGGAWTAADTMGVQVGSLAQRGALGAALGIDAIA